MEPPNNPATISLQPLLPLITPLHPPITLLNRPITPLNRPITPLNRPITLLNRPITPRSPPTAAGRRSRRSWRSRSRTSRCRTPWTSRQCCGSRQFCTGSGLVIFIPFKVDIYSKMWIEYCHITLFVLTKKPSLRKYRYDFLMILVDVLLCKDPDLFFFRIRNTTLRRVCWGRRAGSPRGCSTPRLASLTTWKLLHICIFIQNLNVSIGISLLTYFMKTGTVKQHWI